MSSRPRRRKTKLLGQACGARTANQRKHATIRFCYYELATVLMAHNGTFTKSFTAAKLNSPSMGRYGGREEKGAVGIAVGCWGGVNEDIK